MAMVRRSIAVGCRNSRADGRAFSAASATIRRRVTDGAAGWHRAIAGRSVVVAGVDAVAVPLASPLAEAAVRVSWCVPNKRPAEGGVGHRAVIGLGVESSGKSGFA